jgi:heat shock protein HslJ
MFRLKLSLRDRSAARGRASTARSALACVVALIVAACSVADRQAKDPSPSQVPAKLLEGVWLAEEIGGEPVAGGGQPTLRFTGDGRAGGSGGCNSYSAPVNIDGEGMAFGRLASTRRACEPPLLDQEQKFFIALAGVRSFNLEAGRLTLLDTAARPLVQLSHGP